MKNINNFDEKKVSLQKSMLKKREDSSEIKLNKELTLFSNKFMMLIKKIGKSVNINNKKKEQLKKKNKLIERQLTVIEDENKKFDLINSKYPDLYTKLINNGDLRKIELLEGIKKLLNQIMDETKKQKVSNKKEIKK